MNAVLVTIYHQDFWIIVHRDGDSYYAVYFRALTGHLQIDFVSARLNPRTPEFFDQQIWRTPDYSFSQQVAEFDAEYCIELFLTGQRKPITWP